MTRAEPDGGGRVARTRVLIVDDEAPLRAVIREVLERAGYVPAEAINGLEALAQAAALRPDVILLEVRMRGLDGYEVCRRLKANPETRQIPVLFVTGMEDDELYHLATEAGAVAYLTKPFHLETLPAVIEAALATAEGQPAAQARAEAMDPDRSERVERG